MGVFDDKKLEQLDWMTQITETIDSDLNGLLARLPDRYEIPVFNIIENNAHSYLRIDVSNVVRDLVYKAGESKLSWQELSLVESCFRLQTEGELEFDLRTKNSTGKIYLVKVKSTLSDEELQPLMGAQGISGINSRACDSLERANDVLDLLGKCSEEIKGRSVKNKVRKIRHRLEEIFQTNEWRIRDANLANKVGSWVQGYLENGNLACLMNLGKLKVMTHSNMPIYSIKEEV